MDGRVVVVTGAHGALGSVVARTAAERGARVAVLDHGAEPPAGLLEACGPDVLALGGVDLTDAAAASAAIDAVADRFGRIDALLNIAGGFRWETLEGGSWESWNTLFRLNVLTASNGSRAAIAHLRRSAAGRIVNVGANGAVKASAGMGAYAASKAGVHKLTEALAEELKADGVTVNAVLPSIIDTPANRADMPQADFSTWVSPQALAAVMLFLASEEAGAVTGALIPVTGRV
jgi:NAD(P)-dependent dehydrogenase (short-subunit alcohol dehydrogenase family)